MRSGENRAIIAAAGAHKTQTVIEGALEDLSRRVLVSTYTNENLRQITSRIQQRTGIVPADVRLAGWFAFLLSEGVRPYQASVFGKAAQVGGLNFVGRQPMYARAGTLPFYLDRRGDVFRDAVSSLVCSINTASNGAVIRRLEDIYDQIFIDEVQDLVGWDLEVLDLLFASSINVTVVGDPRQHTFATNQGAKNKRYRGAGLIEWLDERSNVCVREDRDVSYRCHQEICDFASEIFPGFPPIASGHSDVTGHDGVHIVSRFDALEYAERFRPQVLRHDKRANTQGLAATNIGVAKGSTYDRVLIFPAKPMLRYLETRDPSLLRKPEALYVAVTRARHSVAFVK